MSCVLVGGNDIKDVRDLEGENFAIPSKFSTHNILLNQMLEQNGMKYKDVNVVEMPPAEMPAALSEGRISGGLCDPGRRSVPKRSGTSP